MKDNDGQQRGWETTEREKDLAVLVDKLSSHQHGNNTIGKANRVLGVIKRTFAKFTSTVIKKLYTLMVRPTIEYGNAP